MIIEPALVQHPKFIQLKTVVGPMAMEYLVRLWGHCQGNKRGQWWQGATGDYVEVVCTGRTTPKRPVFEALKTCQWVEEREGGIDIHDWSLHNAGLAARWNRDEQRATQASMQTAAQAPTQASAKIARQEREQASMQSRTGQDRTGQDCTGGNNKGRGPGESGVIERQLRTQFAALGVEIKELEGRMDDLTARECEELRKKRATQKAIQKKQAEGKF